MLDMIGENLTECPVCGEELATKTTREYHDEVSEFGYTPYEEFAYQYCKCCGWNKNRDVMY